MPVAARKQIEDDCRPAALTLLTPGGGEDEPALQAMRRSAHALALVPRQLRELRRADRPALEHGLRDVALDGRELLLAEVLSVAGTARERIEVGQQAEGNE